MSSSGPFNNATLLNPSVPISSEMRKAFYAGSGWLQGSAPTLSFVYPGEQDDLRNELGIPKDSLMLLLGVQAPLGKQGYIFTMVGTYSPDMITIPGVSRSWINDIQTFDRHPNGGEPVAFIVKKYTHIQ